MFCVIYPIYIYKFYIFPFRVEEKKSTSSKYAVDTKNYINLKLMITSLDHLQSHYKI